MRAIKRVGMDEKVLIRMKKMLAAHEAEVKEIEAEQRHARKLEEAEAAKIAASIDATEKTDLETPGKLNFSDEKLINPYYNSLTIPLEIKTEDSMEVEADPDKKKHKISLRKMKNEEGKFPAWMTTKKIRKHKNLMKNKAKRNNKAVRDGKKWKLASSL